VINSATLFLALVGPGLGGAPDLPVSTLSEAVASDAGISSHSTPAMLSCLRKKGHRFVRIVRDSFASAEDIGTGEDFTIAVATSEAGSARRFLVVGVEEDPTGVENNIQTLSATPPNRPNKHRRLISS